MLKEIQTKELENRLSNGEKVNIIDVREPFELEVSKIPGVINIPMGEIPLRMEELDREKHYYLICRSGARSGDVGVFLTDHGYNVTNIAGGMLNWTEK